VGTLTGSWQIDGQPDVWDGPPCLGELPKPLARRLAEALATYTERSGRCFFGFWEGWGVPSVMFFFTVDTPEDERRRVREATDAEIAAWRNLRDRAPKFALPDRKLHLIEGPLASVACFYEERRNPPGLWWPEDRAWCVATDIDLMSTYVGGSREAIDALVSDDQIEALAVPVGQSVTWEADTINPLPNPP
jgi:hypothetical protein